ncbi:hypothetical protein BOW53_07270 [Solemya pervernicosa gill symbiont]|uniref:Low-complexity protein n=2 Tax=Gammaproteobacteria incertae sedis TaxID=118884 RepID=A0A1T2L694_9GAMM|nr:hypothetical protein [Candidatus Reidiella endopervernicosa]OOZ40572.1 hypothetical protein BOW53_07270 [Solemya pervernicosa gill symbiont]QKQ27600.1 low-complexity protein [Candidatus Reidiella endopervernicosa]
MSNNKMHKNTIAALGTAFAVSLAAAPMANAAENPFQMTELSSGYMVADNHAGKEGKCGEAKCGGAKADDKAKEGSCGGDKAGKEGSCGGDKAAAPAKASGEGKCGEAKCGGNK